MNALDLTPNQKKLFDEILLECTSGAYAISMVNNQGYIDIYFNASKLAGIRFKNIICDHSKYVVFCNMEGIKEELKEEMKMDLEYWISSGGTEDEFSYESDKVVQLSNILDLYEKYKEVDFTK